MKAAGAQKQRSGSFHCFCFHLHTDCLRSGRAGPSFSVRPEKEAKGAVLHGTSAAERWRHVKTRSANLPKLDDSHRLKHMGRFVFALRSKIPSRATQLVKRYAALAFRKRPAAHQHAGSESDQKLCFFVHLVIPKSLSVFSFVIRKICSVVIPRTWAIFSAV